MIADVLRSRVDTAVDASSSHVHVIVTPRRYDGAAVTLSRDLRLIFKFAACSTRSLFELELM